MGGEGPAGATAVADDRRRRRRAAVVVVALSVSTFGFAAFASSAGTVNPVVQGTGGWRWEPRQSDDHQLPDPIEMEAPPDEASERSVTSDITVGFSQVLAIAALVGVLVLLIHRSVRFARRIRLSPRPVNDDWELAPADARSELTDAAASGLDRIRAGGPVRDVIIECWLALEAAAARAGVERRPSETASELTVRLLGNLDVPAPPVRRLLELYRAARYSTHRLGEPERNDAVEALDEIRRQLAAVPTT